MISRRQKELTDEDITRIGEIYHNWRSREWEDKYQDLPGICKSVDIEVLRRNNYVLTPGRYIDFKEAEDDGELFGEKMTKLISELNEQFIKSGELQKKINENFKQIVLFPKMEQK